MSETAPNQPSRSSAVAPHFLRHKLASLLRSRNALIGVCLMALLFCWALWYNEHRAIGWGQTLNPVYWWHRYRGDDLYDPQNALLLHGNHDLPEVALTFDDGPHPASRARILDILKQVGVHATFFDVGSNIVAFPDLVRRTLAEGHEIGNHSYHHYRLPLLAPDQRHREINDVDIAFYRITGQHLTLLRPPGMRYDASVLDETRRSGYIVVGYTTASRDFDPSESPDFIANRTLRRTENGSIILLHDYASTAAALPQIITALRAQGYRFVTVSEMLAHLPDRYRLASQRFLQAQDNPLLARASSPILSTFVPIANRKSKIENRPMTRLPR